MDEALGARPYRPYIVPVQCTKPDCFVWFYHLDEYCCEPCRWAAERQYEIHEDGSPLGHTEHCRASRAGEGRKRP